MLPFHDIILAMVREMATESSLGVGWMKFYAMLFLAKEYKNDPALMEHDFALFDNDFWDIAFLPIRKSADTVALANTKLCTFAFDKSTNTLTITGPLGNMDPPEDDEDGHLNVLVGFSTGMDDLTDVELDDVAFTEDDVAAAVAAGLGHPGEFVLYAACDSLAEADATYTMDCTGHQQNSITLKFVDNTPVEPDPDPDDNTGSDPDPDPDDTGDDTGSGDDSGSGGTTEDPPAETPSDSEGT